MLYDVVSGGKAMEEWRKKAIDYLKKSDDQDIKKAIKVLLEGKGFLTSRLPIMVIFYRDL